MGTIEDQFFTVQVLPQQPTGVLRPEILTILSICRIMSSYFHKILRQLLIFCIVFFRVHVLHNLLVSLLICNIFMPVVAP
jgi:hypothetical protein